MAPRVPDCVIPADVPDRQDGLLTFFNIEEHALSPSIEGPITMQAILQESSRWLFHVDEATAGAKCRLLHGSAW